MACQTHGPHDHIHKKGCGHTQIKHGDHVDFLHGGHLHYAHGDHVDEHVIEQSTRNPVACQSLECTHTAEHAQQAEVVPHADHVDYLVNGRLHHLHGNHCDDHGAIDLA